MSFPSMSIFEFLILSTVLQSHYINVIFIFIVNKVIKMLDEIFLSTSTVNKYLFSTFLSLSCIFAWLCLFVGFVGPLIYLTIGRKSLESFYCSEGSHIITDWAVPPKQLNDNRFSNSQIWSIFLPRGLFSVQSCNNLILRLWWTGTGFLNRHSHHQ